GNGLVIASVLKNRALQTATNFLIVNLAVADFLVALCVMPFAVYVERRHFGTTQLGESYFGAN
uniref:G-protein coupled receptors family 1 profile domain-containing protein n=1 Tax=Romanomermis culicivorax TaxID=13658 RepID=A0A915KTT4_ROMCU